MVDAKRWRRSHQAVFLGPCCSVVGLEVGVPLQARPQRLVLPVVRARRDDRGRAMSTSAASARRDWAIVNAWLLMKHRHLHPVIREAIRYWIAYGKGAT